MLFKCSFSKKSVLLVLLAILLSAGSLFAGQKSGEGAAKISIRIDLPPVKETVGSADITLIYKEGRCCFIQAASAPGLSNVTVMANNNEKNARVRIALLPLTV